MDIRNGFDSPEAAELASMLHAIANAAERDEHFRAVQLLCTVVSDLYTGILALVANQNGIAAQALVRTLFETIVTTVILANRPDLLETFRRHGKYTHLRTLHFAKTDISEEAGKKRAALHAKYKNEIETLHNEFGDKHWHGLTTSDAIGAAGFEKNLHGRYYRPASAVAHGQPHTIVRFGEQGACTFQRTTSGKVNQLYGAYILSSMMVAHLLERIGSIFGFDFFERLEVSRSGINVWKARHVDFFAKVVS